jgi:amino acid transporter
MTNGSAMDPATGEPDEKGLRSGAIGFVELSARVQQTLLGIEVLILVAFAVVALIKVYTGASAGSIHPSLGWLNPFALPLGSLVDGVLLGVFVYWGWDAGVTVNEESVDSETGPGRAAVLSTVLLLVIFVLVSTAGQAVAGPAFLADHSTDVLSVLGAKVFGSPWDKLLILVVLTSTAASTQTTIMPTARTTLSMARWGALPAVLGRIHPRFRTPSVSTLLMGAISTAWTVVLLVVNPAQSVLGDSISALGFLIAFYYGITGVACLVYHRRRLRERARAFLGLGLIPGAGALMLGGIFIKALTITPGRRSGDSSSTTRRRSPASKFPCHRHWRAAARRCPHAAHPPAFRPYFRRRPEALPALEEPVLTVGASHA